MRKIDIYIDGPTEIEMTKLTNENVRGYTFNPTLFKRLGVTNYIEHCQKVLALSRNLPLSLEVIGDNYDQMVSQANQLSALGQNVYVKIPISYTSGISTIDTIKTLVKSRVNLNITAVFTVDQIRLILPEIKDTKTIISVFAGRLYDIGLDAAIITREISKLVKNNSSCRLLWASPRMHYDSITAENVGCDIITMTSAMYKKMSMLGKSPEDYSLDTVRMFYNDAVESGFKV